MKAQSPPGFLILACLGLLALSAPLPAAMPQDNWSYYGKKLAVPDAAQKKGVAIGNGAIFVGACNASTATTSIQKYSAEGAFVSTFATGFTDVAGMVCDAAGNLYVFDYGQPALKAFSPSGALLWSTGSAGTGPQQFSATPYAYQHALLAMDPQERLFVLDRGNSRVQIFDTQGNFQSLWGTHGSSGGQLNNPFGIAARNDKILILDTPGSPIQQRIQTFSNAGVFVNSRMVTGGGGGIPPRTERFAVSPDGLLAVVSGSSLLDENLATVGNLAVPNSTSNIRFGFAFAPAGDAWAVVAADVWLMERRYFSTDNPVVRNALPQPKVINVAQRPASTLLDIDYQVLDADSPTVEVAALAFVNGGDTLAEILRLATLVEGTDVNVGPGQAPNVTKRLTWNASADWSSTFGEVQIEVLAKDQRDLLGIHWITVPASGGVPAFQASAMPVDDAAMLSVWYWLIAKGDSAISLINGEVKGVGGTFNGQVLASGATTTPAGRQFIHDRIGVRAITTPELTSLQSGNYGFSASGTTTVVKP